MQLFAPADTPRGVRTARINTRNYAHLGDFVTWFVAIARNRPKLCPAACLLMLYL